MIPILVVASNTLFDTLITLFVVSLCIIIFSGVGDIHCCCDIVNDENIDTSSFFAIGVLIIYLLLLFITTIFTTTTMVVTTIITKVVNIITKVVNTINL